MPKVDVERLGKVFKIPHERKNTLFEHVKALLDQSMSYEKMWALRDVSFKVEGGQMLGIIGVNGSGKSTLLSLMAGVLRPTEGRISVEGRVTPFLELGAGFKHDLTARENVFLYGVIMGLTRSEVRARYDDIVAFSELEEFMDTKIQNLSTGMYMRLAFSIAVHVDPGVLLIDEVLAVGDRYFQEKCFRKIEGFKREGKAIVLVSHNMGDVTRFCTKAILLDKGGIAAVGKPKDVVGIYEHFRNGAVKKR